MCSYLATHINRTSAVRGVNRAGSQMKRTRRREATSGEKNIKLNKGGKKYRRAVYRYPSIANRALLCFAWWFFLFFCYSFTATVSHVYPHIFPSNGHIHICKRGCTLMTDPGRDEILIRVFLFLASFSLPPNETERTHHRDM